MHRVRLHLKMKQYYFARWSGEAFRTFRLAALEKTFAERRRTACLGRAFKKWRTVHLIFLYERKKKSLQSVVTWRWLTKYTSLFTESETRIQELEKECERLYTWEKTTCRELKEAAAALEIGDETKRRLEKELADAKVEAVRSKEEGFLQAMEASRNLLPNVSKNISMLSLAHLNLKSNVQVGTEDERSPKLGEIVGLTDCNSILSLSLSGLERTTKRRGPLRIWTSSVGRSRTGHRIPRASPRALLTTWATSRLRALVRLQSLTCVSLHTNSS